MANETERGTVHRHGQHATVATWQAMVRRRVPQPSDGRSVIPGSARTGSTGPGHEWAALSTAKWGFAMSSLRSWLLCGLLLASAPASAQLYGTSPFQNGPAPENGSLYTFDPDTLTWITGVRVTLTGFTITGITGLTTHPNLAPPDDALNGRIYAILKLQGVTGRVLATIDPATGEATQIGNLGDNFSSLSFREDGQLFGVTGNGATVPETLWLIDKATGTRSIATPLGAGADGDIAAYNPVDDFFYHWSGNATVVYERVQSAPPFTITNIPTTGAPPGETFGAVWDPCQTRDIGGVQTLVFIASNINSRFNFWTPAGTISAPLGTTPDDIRGLALVGGYTCEVDVGVGAGSANPAPPAGSPIAVDVVIDNAGEARAMRPVITLALPPSLSSATTTGCVEDPAGIPTCTPRIFVPRYDTTSMTHVPFEITNLWKGRTATVRIDATYDGNAGEVVATVSSSSTETQPADNTVRYLLGEALFADSFE
jgi:hypothetical protein